MTKQENARKQRNKELLEAVARGEAITLISNQNASFPMRPIIKKDPKALDFICKKEKPN